MKAPIPPELRDLLQKKSPSDLYQYGKIVMPGMHVVFDATKIRQQVYDGKKYYQLTEGSGVELFINDDPEDNHAFFSPWIRTSAWIMMGSKSVLKRIVLNHGRRAYPLVMKSHAASQSSMTT